jgi:peptide/nickel transport system permease protein
VSPIDPVDEVLLRKGLKIDNSDKYKKAYDQQSKLLGLDLPLFYFSLEVQEKNALNIYYNFPHVRVNGFKNQFHGWLVKIGRLDFGKSYIDGKPVIFKIWKAAKWTIPTILTSIFLAMVLSLMIGKYLALKDGNAFSKILEGVFAVLYSIPQFWLATLIIIYFSNDLFGIKLISINRPMIGSTVWDNLVQVFPMVFCIVVSDLAYLTTMYKTNVKAEMGKNYFTFAISKGLSKEEAVSRHAAPNGLISLITIMIGAIPSAMAGSVILEKVFNIPGLGRLVYESIQKGDWLVIYAFVLLLALFTSLSYILSDIALVYLNPRVSFNANK